MAASVVGVVPRDRTDFRLPRDQQLHARALAAHGGDRYSNIRRLRLMNDNDVTRQPFDCTPCIPADRADLAWRVKTLSPADRPD